MTEETTTAWDPLIAEELNADQEVRTPEYTIWGFPEERWGIIPQIQYVNFYPTRAAKRSDPRVRQVAMVLPVNQSTGMVPVVQPAKAGSNEWALIQGGIKSNETARDAALREAREEAGLDELTDVQYVGSYKAPVNEEAEKKQWYDYQLFHCFVAKTDSVAVQSNCDQVAHASLFHHDVFLQALFQTASSVKQKLLPLLCQAAVEHDMLPPSACRRS